LPGQIMTTRAYQGACGPGQDNDQTCSNRGVRVSIAMKIQQIMPAVDSINCN